LGEAVGDLVCPAVDVSWLAVNVATRALVKPVWSSELEGPACEVVNVVDEMGGWAVDLGD